MADVGVKHAFISYVREDSGRVDELCKVLEASGIPYWRDRTSLAPGDAWKAKIREAIRDESLAFLACFSANSVARQKSHMNEELTLAVDEYRKMPPGRTWLIPVRFDDRPLPDWDLGAGRSLGDLNQVDLFGPGYAPQVGSLVTAVGRLLSGQAPSQQASLASLDAAAGDARATLLRRLTKEMLPDPARRIQLDEVISREVRRIVESENDSKRFPTSSLEGSDRERTVALVTTAQDLWGLVEPFCHSLQVAARWGSVDDLGPWVAGLRAQVAGATRLQGGVEALLKLKHLPAIAAIMTAALACTASEQWHNLKALVFDPTVVDNQNAGRRTRILDATSPWEPFKYAERAASVFARATIAKEDPDVAFGHFADKGGGHYYAPLAEWLHASLRSVFDDQLLDNADFTHEFDRAEIVLGVLSQDSAMQAHAAAPDRSWLAGSQWFGRSVWRSRRLDANPVAELADNLRAHGSEWAPLQAGLFGSSVDRADKAIEAYAERFEKIGRTQL